MNFCVATRYEQQRVGNQFVAACGIICCLHCKRATIVWALANKKWPWAPGKSSHNALCRIAE